MAWDELGTGAEVDNKRNGSRWIGVYIGALAVMLAICGIGGSNASKEATLKNIEAADTWAFFQAKNMRRHVLRMQSDELELLLLSRPDLAETARAAITAKIASYMEQDKALTSNAKSGEGLDELFGKGKALEAERDRAMRQDPYFDIAQAFLQIAIVLTSVTIISGGRALLLVCAVLGGLGLLATINGFTLALAVPFIE